MKRAKPFAALSASKKHLDKQGWVSGVVESRIPHTFITRDLFGFADLLAFKPRTREIALVQVTGGAGVSNANARIAKIKSEPLAAMWLMAGGLIFVHSWQTVKGQKDRKLRMWNIVNLGSSIGAVEL